MKPNTHYTPTETGFSISGSSEIFNRTLYGSHQNDDNSDRFFTFAGDAPQFMGAISDWTKSNVTLYEKCGILRSGLAVTPGRRSAYWYSKDIDITSRWFHDSDDIDAEFKNGWMEYDLSQISAWFPDTHTNIEAYPLLPDDGYLIHYHITTNQRVFLAAGFGGITGENCRARYEYKGEPKRHFVPENVEGNVVTIGKNRACVTHTDGKKMHIATTFPAEFEIGSAKAMADVYPSTFLDSTPENENDQVVRIAAPIEPDQVLDGYIIVLYNADEETVDKWVNMKNPAAYVKEQIYEKFACIDVATPERPLDLTINPTVVALDASWHKDSFHHGSFAYHTPFLGWRNWYAPTALGWSDRVKKTIEMWLSYITRGDIKNEKVWYDETVVPDSWVGRWHTQENPVGRLPAYFTSDGKPLYGPYNMQECALDMMLYFIEWSGDLEFAAKHFDDLCAMADWETRTFDPDDDGLYQSVLNTWTSDGHNYNGAGCAQSTAYNYRANKVIAQIAKKIGRDGSAYEKRAEKILKALHEKLWIPERGVFAEYLDTIGNCLIHPSVELPTIFHVIDSDMTDDLTAYRFLRYPEARLKSVNITGSNGILYYASNWLPKQYSQCGIFPAENAHLALMYYKIGLYREGKKILDGLTDCYFTGKNPGLASHVQSSKGTSDLGDFDFTDVSSTYLRLITEGLFGIRVNTLEGYVYIQPGFPEDWDTASLALKDITLNYTRKGNQETFNIWCEKEETKRIKLPMRACDIDAVMLDGKPVDYEIVASANNSFIIVKTDKSGAFQLRVIHGKKALPTVAYPKDIIAKNRFAFEVKGADIIEISDISEALEDIKIINNKVYATAKNLNGDYTLFIHVKSDQYDAWLAADYNIIAEEVEETPLADIPFKPVDISEFFNCSMTTLHEQAYIQPRPKGFSMGLHQNGRYSHNWNQRGRNQIYVDDSLFRNSGGMITSPSGIPFKTPAENNNLACVSIFDVFPTSITMPLSGKGQEVAIMFVASSNHLLTDVENIRVTINYADGTSTKSKLVYPYSLDDWLTSALTTESEIFYFSNYNHATIKRLRLDTTKELESISFEAICNDVILGVAGISVSEI